MKNSTYLKLTLSIGLGLLILFAGINIYVDPLFHFHAPTKGIEYPLYDERYMDDGILRNFDYDAVITGTSMTQNFKTSQFDQFFGTNSVKVPSSGGTYKEIGDLLRRAFEYNPNIRYVMRSLDTTVLVADKDALDYEEYPDYLYDRNPFNDVNYVLNKDLYNKYTEYVFTYNRLDGNTTPFDVYKNWSGVYEVNGAKLLAEHVRREKTDEKKIFTEEDAKMLSENLEQNVLSLVRSILKLSFTSLILLTVCFSLMICIATEKLIITLMHGLRKRRCFYSMTMFISSVSGWTLPSCWILNIIRIRFTMSRRLATT